MQGLFCSVQTRTDLQSFPCVGGKDRVLSGCKRDSSQENNQPTQNQTTWHNSFYAEEKIHLQRWHDLFLHLVPGYGEGSSGRVFRETSRGQACIESGPIPLPGPWQVCSSQGLMVFFGLEQRRPRGLFFCSFQHCFGAWSQSYREEDRKEREEWLGDARRKSKRSFQPLASNELGATKIYTMSLSNLNLLVSPVCSKHRKQFTPFLFIKGFCIKRNPLSPAQLSVSYMISVILHRQWVQIWINLVSSQLKYAFREVALSKVCQPDHITWNRQNTLWAYIWPSFHYSQ